MSNVFDRNDDMLFGPVNDVAIGPKVGFLRAFELAYKESVMYRGWMSAEKQLRDREEDNVRRIRDAGGTAPNTLNNMDIDVIAGGGIFNKSEYRDYMQALNESLTFSSVDDDESRKQHVVDERVSTLLGDRNKQLATLKQQYPDAGIETYEEMVGGIIAETTEARKRLARSSYSGVGGAVGGFLGGAVGGMHPESDPLNFLTLMMGGAGRNIFQRLLSQFGAQTVIETVNQFTGSRESKRLLGGQPTAVETLTDIALAGTGGAVGQLGGEIIGAGLRAVGVGVPADARPGRWFQDEEAPPLPEPERPPIDVTPPPAAPAPRTEPSALDRVLARIEGGETRLGRVRGAQDLGDVAAQLSSWSQTAAAILPTTGRGAGEIELPDAWARAAARDVSLDEIARNLDPAIFKRYDTLVTQRAALRRTVGIVDEKDVAVRTAERTRLENRVADLERRMANARTDAQRDKAAAQLVIAQQELRGAEPPGWLERAIEARSKARPEIDRIEGKLKEIQPLLERAYARAQGTWGLYEGQRQQVQQMIEQGRRALPESPIITRAEKTLSEPEGVSLADRVPELATNAETVKATEPAVDIVQRMAAKNADQMDAGLEQLQAEASRIAKAEGEEIELTIEGHTYTLKAGDRLPDTEGGNPDGITVREAMQQLDEDVQAIKAIGTCSIGTAL